MLLDYTVQALDRQSSGKDVRKSVQDKSELYIASPFAKKESQVYVKEIQSMQEPSKEMLVQVFGGTSTWKAAAGEEAGMLQSTVITQKSESAKIGKTASQVERETAPKILLKLRDLTVGCGDTAQFICAFESENFHIVLWTHNGEMLQESTRIRVSQSGTVLFLTIVDIQLLDQGLYSCTVRNDYGEVTTAAILTVEGGYSDF